MNCSSIAVCCDLSPVQTAVWSVMKGSSCVQEDAASSTSTAVTAMMTVETSVMKGGVLSCYLNF